MRVLLLSDIHSNLQALEACLQAAPEYDIAVNLGDLVGYGANPNEVIARVRSLGNTFVRGNHDKACSGVSNMENFNPVAAMAALWTRTMLNSESAAWLRALPAGPIRLANLQAQFVHGSPLDEDEYLLAAGDAIEALRSAAAPITFFGHTHVQGGFQMEINGGKTLRVSYSNRQEPERFELRLDLAGRYLVNPGSVGQPRDSDWRAAFALYESDAPAITFFRVPYDIAEAQRRIREAGLPEVLADRLALGR